MSICSCTRRSFETFNLITIHFEHFLIILKLLGPSNRLDSRVGLARYWHKMYFNFKYSLEDRLETSRILGIDDIRDAFTVDFQITGNTVVNKALI